jgi:distribution and morphology protein 34
MEGSSSSHNSPPLATPSLARSNSFQGTATTYTFSDSGSSAHGHLPARPSLVSLHSATTGLSLGSGTRSRSYQGRKKRTRVVNLRKTRSENGGSEAGDSVSEATSDAGSVANAVSEPLVSSSIPEEPEDEEITQIPHPSVSLPTRVRFETGRGQEAPLPVRSPTMEVLRKLEDEPAISSSAVQVPEATSTPLPTPLPATVPIYASEKSSTRAGQNEKAPALSEMNQAASSDTSSVILEQVWIMKMAGEIARRVYEEKSRHQGSFWEDREETPPPAYTPESR